MILDIYFLASHYQKHLYIMYHQFINFIGDIIVNLNLNPKLYLDIKVKQFYYFNEILAFLDHAYILSQS